MVEPTSPREKADRDFVAGLKAAIEAHVARRRAQSPEPNALGYEEMDLPDWPGKPAA